MRASESAIATLVACCWASVRSSASCPLPTPPAADAAAVLAAWVAASRAEAPAAEILAVACSGGAGKRQSGCAHKHTLCRAQGPLCCSCHDHGGKRRGEWRGGGGQCRSWQMHEQAKGVCVARHCLGGAGGQKGGPCV